MRYAVEIAVVNFSNVKRKFSQILWASSNSTAQSEWIKKCQILLLYYKDIIGKKGNFFLSSKIDWKTLCEIFSSKTKTFCELYFLVLAPSSSKLKTKKLIFPTKHSENMSFIEKSSNCELG